MKREWLYMKEKKKNFLKKKKQKLIHENENI